MLVKLFRETTTAATPSFDELNLLNFSSAESSNTLAVSFETLRDTCHPAGYSLSMSGLSFWVIARVTIDNDVKIFEFKTLLQVA